MKLVAIFLFLLVVGVHSADIRKLKTTPRGIDIRDWNEFMGKWYSYANLHPCSWSGAAKFTDWVYIHVMNKDKYPEFKILDEWRKGSCSRTESQCYPTSQGCYTAVDTMGDLWSGKAVLVDGDKRFKHYAISWGCTKYLGEECADYWVCVTTRQPNPGQNVIDKINRKLVKFWDTSLSEMILVPHKNPCEHSLSPPNPVPSQKWKTY